MIDRLIKIFKEPPAAPRIQGEKDTAEVYRRWRARMLYGSMIGYALFYLTRKNISVALPLLSKDLGYSNTELGILGSLLYISYAIGKGSLGFFGDRADSRRFMAFGLTVSAIINILFGFSESLLVFGILWTMNGLFQAMGAPACAKICVKWYSVSERGTKWAIWNISHQTGGGVILILAAWLCSWFGWRGAFIGPALICLVGVFFILNRLRDRPEAIGLPPVDVYRNDPETTETAQQSGKAHESFFSLVAHRVLLNPRLLLFATGSLLVYVVRYGVMDWATKYLVEEKGAEIGWAGTMVSLVEFIGIPGCLIAGWISDRFFNARRAPISIIFLFLLAVSVAMFYSVPAGNLWLDAAMIGAIGFFTYGPQMILAGVAAADSCGAEVAAAAVGVTGVFSYIGAIISSFGTGALIDSFGWGGAFSLWISSAVLGGILLLPLWNARGRNR
ncbi:MAG: MFS transporter [Deltaproteobacteria bacterium]|nr:MFS transporter [Deltaproteobacteria bacterium]